MRSVHYLFNAVIATFCLFFVSLSYALIPHNGGGGGGGTATVIGGGGLSGIGGALNSGGAAAAAAAGFAPGATAPSSSNGTTGTNTGTATGAAAGAAMGNLPVMNDLPVPPYNLPPEKLKKLNEGLASLARMYQQELKNLESQKLSAKSSYESWIVDCHGQNQSYGAAAIKNCIDSAKKTFDDKIAELDKKMAEKVDMFNQAVKDLYAAYGVDIGKTPNVTAPNATGATDVITDSNGNKFCKINGAWQPCGGVGVGPDAISNDTVVGTATDINGNKICKINGTWQPCGGVGVGPDSISGGTVGTGTNTGTGTATNSGTNSSTSTNTAAGTTANSTTTSNTTNSTTNTTNINNTTVPDIKFEDLNDFADYCKANPEAVVCMKMDKEVPDATGVLNDLISELKNSENAPKFVLNNLFGSGVGTCPRPLQMNAMGYQIGLSFDTFCEFLRLIRPLIIAFSWLTTGFFVLSGIKS